MTDLIFATNNKNKLLEASKLLNKNYHIISLDEALTKKIEIPEDFETLRENAIQKAEFIHRLTNKNGFADDTGLEVEALDNKPGVYSARFASIVKNNKELEGNGEENMHTLLELMHKEPNRKARFRTVIALILNNNTHTFEGEVEGTIALKKSGEKGFGYDPIFIPNGYKISFAEMELNQKNKISHRAKALIKLSNFLNG